MAMGSVQKNKRARVSKNRKKNWNKHCDVKDVEEFLEEKRFNDRIGGAVSEKSDAELYFIQNDVVEPEVTPKSGAKPLKCFRNIASYSKVPVPVQRTLEPFSKKIKNFITRGDEKRRKRSLANSSKEKKEISKNFVQVGDMFSAELKDLWMDEKNQVDSDIKDLVTFRDEYTCKRTPKVPGHRFQKPSLLPSVEVPHSGASYNPDFTDHQDLLREAVVIEEAKQKEELHLKRVLTDMFPTRDEAPTQESILKEMSQGLFEETDSEEEDMDSNLYSRNPPVSYDDRIPKARKRRKRERKEAERLRLFEKLQKKRHNEVFRIKSLKSEITKEKAEIQKKVEKNLERKIEKMYKPKTLSKHKYEAPDLEVNLSEEITGSLRTLKTEGNLLEDRYKSLQRRNLIEPRIIQKRKRKYKLKVQVKRNHRDFK